MTLNPIVTSKRILSLTLVVGFILAGCGKAPPTEAPTATPTQTATPLPTPTNTPIPSATAPAPINYLVDVENAIVQIEAQGKFYSPKFAKTTGTPGRGSGFIIDPSGIAITTNQAVAGADQVKVWVGKNHDTPHSAKVIAASECDDLAVLAIEGGPFDFLAWSPEPLEDRQKVYVAGFQLGSQLFQTISGNIQNLQADAKTITGSTKPLIEYDIQTNPGMSGGPVLTPDGKVIGIHYTAGAQEKQAYGIAADTIAGTIDQLKAGQNVASIGLNAEPVTSEDGTLAGMWVYAVQADSLASQAGIEGGDLITQLNKQYLGSGASIGAAYCELLNNWDASGPLDIQVYRPTNDTVLEGQLNGSKLVVISNEYLGPLLTPEAGTVVAPNLGASKSGDVYYREEFDGPLVSWSRLVLQGNEEKVDVEVKDSKLVMTIDAIYTYVYYLFKPLKVTDVRLDIKAENLGRNNNNISLVCRYSVEKGWYEFNIASNGLYWVKRYDPRFNNYADIGKGASRLINLGQATNEYGAVCKDNKLTLFINGKEVRTFTDNALVNGQVGFSVSSFNVTPVTVALDYFKISVP